ncbi:uncharacterized protein LOC116141038 [Pistacia vera]|uniref:uncharacterized protein LOC116141038 n=1 Tax=Pistacia vera TaxID=55513 RepID=UPI001262CEB8|nr:uncharacterized protein LOC116141038 [Pistacia vera]
MLQVVLGWLVVFAVSIVLLLVGIAAVDFCTFLFARKFWRDRGFSRVAACLLHLVEVWEILAACSVLCNIAIGNEKSNKFWEAELPSNFDRSRIEKFIHTNYEEKRWSPKGEREPAAKPAETNHDINKFPEGVPRRCQRLSFKKTKGTFSRILFLLSTCLK